MLENMSPQALEALERSAVGSRVEQHLGHSASAELWRRSMARGEFHAAQQMPEEPSEGTMVEQAVHVNQPEPWDQVVPGT
jgi:hypothetical protein